MMKVEVNKILKFPQDLLQGASLGEKIASELRMQIISGQLEQGTVLSENHIAAEFGTSRAPVRDALKILSNEGLIRLERMGVTVLGLNYEDMQELYDVRFLIEGFVIEKLSKVFNEEKASQLNQIVDKMELAGKHLNVIDFSQYDMEFHDTMIGYSNHNRVLRLWESIREIIFAALLVATQNRFDHQPDEVPKLVQHHRKIISAIETGDSKHIKQVVKEHYSDTFSTISKSLPILRKE